MPDQVAFYLSQSRKERTISFRQLPNKIPSREEDAFATKMPGNQLIDDKMKDITFEIFRAIMVNVDSGSILNVQLNTMEGPWHLLARFLRVAAEDNGLQKTECPAQ